MLCRLVCGSMSLLGHYFELGEVHCSLTIPPPAAVQAGRDSNGDHTEDLHQPARPWFTQRSWLRNAVASVHFILAVEPEFLG